MDTTGLPIIKNCKMILHGNDLINKIAADKLEYVNMLGIPCDGHNDDIINTFRNNISIRDIEEILVELSKHHIPVCINTVVTKLNCNHLNEILDFIQKFKCVKK